jgi:hypothetical protein
MLPNAEGLSWIGEQQLLFSEIKSGIHMGLVTATESRAESRDIYLPPHERGMAHRSSLSPDQNWVLLTEMDNGGWLPCRLVPFDGSSAGKTVGPPRASCTNAVWSPDGIWRARFPDGAPEQITFGPNEEEGIAPTPDGRALVTSGGASQSSVWLHDARGERQITSEGSAFSPSFSRDGKSLYFLVSQRAIRDFPSGELWAAQLDTGHLDRILPGVLMTYYSVSVDGKRVAYSALGDGGQWRLWLALLDRRSSPRQLPSSTSDDVPIFLPSGEIIFRAREEKSNYLCRVKEDGSGRQKVIPDPIIFLNGASPDGNWAVVYEATVGEETTGESLAIPIHGGTPLHLCGGCSLKWSNDGHFLYLTFYFQNRGMGEGQTLVIGLRPGTDFPRWPPAGIKSEADLLSLHALRVIPLQEVAPGPDNATYAFVRNAAHRNLYRIPLP